MKYFSFNWNNSLIEWTIFAFSCKFHSNEEFFIPLCHFFLFKCDNYDLTCYILCNNGIYYNRKKINTQNTITASYMFAISIWSTAFIYKAKFSLKSCVNFC